MFGFWLGAAINGFRSLWHLSGRRSLGRMLVAGIEWFNPENFTERGRALQRTFARCALGFFLTGAVLVLLAVLATTQGP